MKPRKKKQALPMRHGPLQGDAKVRQERAIRSLSWRSHGELRAVLQNPSSEARQWARSGELARLVMSKGTPSDMRLLAAMDMHIKPGQNWEKAQRCSRWSREDTASWLDILFQHGWTGNGRLEPGSVEPLVAIAQHHPDLLAMWKEHAPETWRTRRQWMAGKMGLGDMSSPELARAYLLVGGRFGSPTLENLLEWMNDTGLRHKREDAHFTQILEAIDQAEVEDRTRRRHPGDPPVYAWPWSDTAQAAATLGRAGVLEWLTRHKAKISLNLKQVERWLLATSDPAKMVDFIKARQWPMHEGPQATRFFNRALAGFSNANKSHRTVLLEKLLSQGVKVKLDGPATAAVQLLPHHLMARIQAAQMRASTSTPRGTCRPSRRL